ncbi:class I SAM-dependent methyltransferase [Lentisphaerota bacterium ZTH]|nr:class I SAM-dependent methyltransferase [Lentisphaerota bacterium]WET05152.1 class I SAM-dependent methyltransferase [Lentisphaerota bacterium ZTH]
MDTNEKTSNKQVNSNQTSKNESVKKNDQNAEARIEPADASSQPEPAAANSQPQNIVAEEEDKTFDCPNMEAMLQNIRSHERITDQDLEEFKRCILNDKVYFGKVMFATQGVPDRHRVMQALVREKRKEGFDSISIMEIGTWAGGSALTWAESVTKYFDNNGDVICVDPLVPYFDKNIDRSVYVAMRNALKEGYIVDLLLHNIKCSGHGDHIKLMKCPSDFLIPMLKDEQVDILFIDGNHNYAAVKKDLENYSRIVKEGGYICGDDLELHITDIDIEQARQHLNYDYIQDNKTERFYHPGVTLAVGEFFNEHVSEREGLWVQRKVNGKWQNIEMPDYSDIPIPEHFLANT